MAKRNKNNKRCQYQNVNYLLLNWNWLKKVQNYT